MISLNQLQTHVIDYTLKHIDLYSPEASILVLITGFIESRYQYVKQVGTGPARSFWQVEPATAHDNYDNYLRYDARKGLREKIDSLRGDRITDSLTYNMGFAVAMCRLKYYRSPLKIPAINDIQKQAAIWKMVYNTPGGAGTEQKAVKYINELRGIAPGLFNED